MRTTLTLDDDIADALKERARLLDKPFKQVVNEILRRGLSPAPEERRPVIEVKPICSGLRPGIDPLKLNELYGQLETEDFLREQERDRP
ncbi:MAG: hypothetical protein F4Y92_04805 [Dehalococcoidia bacterium]|nr:antitoxin [Chloroflexota bacterium]MXY88157.1 hypothetical protein [Dehalococcoidia bacterium]MXZ89501.1 hypothetical protein [Dehalococcoidia bacterium]MYH67660.1 hypothetical protein [Dehalococcoidia bacterium]MYI85312.1 hypothetical protein [Dehalococcoidia bacterium]